MMNTHRVALRPNRTVIAGTAPLVAMVLLAAPAGLVWSAVAPRPELVLTVEGAVYARPEPLAVIAADGWFAVVTSVAGLLCGLAAFALVRRVSVVVLLGLAAGGLLAAFITWQVGRTVDFAAFQQQVQALPNGTSVQGFLQVRALGLLVLWPLFALLSFLALQPLTPISGGSTYRSPEIS